MKDKIVEFLRSKDYKFIKDIGQGGTGKTVLLQDELINEEFVCKKYSPYFEKDKMIYYKNFVDEIKLLHLLYHKNVVRVFNYHLYPEKTTGYILMEFIKGDKITAYIKENPEKLDEIFIQTINGFRYLEENEILHRDIRPENIMVSNDGIVKIIDFGFGKKINFEDDFENSISINWRYSAPKDFESKIYDFKTEVYFIGKLFEEIIQENKIEDFKFSSTLLLMVNPNYQERISSFFEVDRKLISGDSTTIEFSVEDRRTYLAFANSLENLYSKIENGAEYHKDIDALILALENTYRNSVLEYHIQNPLTISRCFVRGQYYFKNKATFEVIDLKLFIQLFKSVSVDKKRIILNNLWQRLDKIQRFKEEDELPF